MKMKFALIFFLIILNFLAVPELFAGDKTESDNAENKIETADGWISNGKHLGRWWAGRAKKQDPLPPQLLYHIDVSYSFKDVTGDDEVTSHKIRANLKLRKGLITSTTSFTLKDKEQSYGGMPSSKTDKKVFEESIFYEAFEKTDVFVGFQWKEDNKRHIKDRYICSLGLYHEFFTSPFRLRAGAAYGYADISYSTDDPVYNTDLAVFFSDLTWPITDRISFTGSGLYFQYLKDTDFKFWGVTFKLDYKITDNISIFTSYQVDYEKDLMDQKYPDIKKKNTELGCGIKLSL